MIGGQKSDASYCVYAGCYHLSFQGCHVYHSQILRVWCVASCLDYFRREEASMKAFVIGACLATLSILALWLWIESRLRIAMEASN